MKRYVLLIIVFLIPCVQLLDCDTLPTVLDKKYQPEQLPKNYNVLWKALTSLKPKEEKHIVVIIPSYNNKAWYQPNIDSVLMQDYKNYSVIYVDDCSPDGTGTLVEAYTKICKLGHKVNVIKNKERRGAMANWYHAIHTCNDTSIVVQLDGDDWLAHKNVLKLVNKIYENKNVWLTYGQYINWPINKVGYPRAYPKEVIKNRSFRAYGREKRTGWFMNHLRTFYAGLFKKIKPEDLMIDGKFVPTSCDMAMMYPMAEMAGHRIMFVPDIVYIRNVATPINDFKVNVDIQTVCNRVIRHRPIYSFLTNLESKI